LCLVDPGVGASLGANGSQFTGIQPVTRAVGTLIDLDFAFCAKEMPEQFDALAAGTFAFANGIHHDVLIPLELHQRLSSLLVLIVDLLELESVKPDPAATALANVDDELADLKLAQFVEASRAFHLNIDCTKLARFQWAWGLPSVRNSQNPLELGVVGEI
jgi:hypothetical protein